ncbi:hypothetical protein DSCO28_59470 [Desulfosarcina ovata subsp. sediminis]|uniref:NADPH-dependent FMN reductase-like domain-containing protein n=1 Tax=Desulfosarcina ovata subsp. sediminis TaxID=885957 RepID=A0A5K7ZZ15_9BACT|nr:NAD(P)H-dependent oxidoreductase [Desulfosarcina ovata]BBO85381.1 hypothetical protein DSCO28_59470 [Desulfosarcina ovata subsp. sediminis]
MTTDDWQEKRKDRRFPFSKKDAVYCVVLRAKSAGTTIALSTVDFSESGFQFAIIPNLKEDFFTGERLYLKAIVGTRNLTFKEPIELAIRWQRHDNESDAIRIGCEICRIATEAEKQFIEFIQAEVKFKGIRAQASPRGKTNAVGRTHPDAAPRIQADPSATDVVSIFGGDSATDDSAAVLGWVENELTSLGHRVERIDLFAKAIHGCSGCLRCQNNPNAPGCIQNDDIATILRRMLDAELIIYTSPIYFTGFSLPMKALMDRSFSLFRKSGGDLAHASFMEGKRQALIATAAGSFADDATPALAVFHRLGRYHKVRTAGSLLVCNCRDAERFEEEIRFQAKKFAHQLLDPAKKPHIIMIPGDA